MTSKKWKQVSPLSTLFPRIVNPSSIRVKNQVKRYFQPLHLICISTLVFNSLHYQAQQIRWSNRERRSKTQRAFEKAARNIQAEVTSSELIPGLARFPPADTPPGHRILGQKTFLRLLG